jgi:hypothetical protein
MIHSLEIYFNQSIKDEVKEWGPYTQKTSNEIELGDGDNYRLYFYYYEPKANVLYIRDGVGENNNYSEHSQLFDYLLNVFHVSFVSIDLVNDKVSMRNYQ